MKKLVWVRVRFFAFDRERTIELTRYEDAEPLTTRVLVDILRAMADGHDLRVLGETRLGPVEEDEPL